MANIIFADGKSVDTSNPPSTYDAFRAQTAVLLVLSDNVSSQSPQSRTVYNIQHILNICSGPVLVSFT